MAKRILVPLDWTPAAEAIVPLVKDLATGAGATVCLLYVAPMPENVVTDEGRVLSYVDQEMARLEVEGLDYLRAVEIGLDGVPVEPVIRFGDPREKILEEAEAFAAELIVLTSERRWALGRAALGATAEYVVRKAPMAVAVVRPPRSRP